MTRKRNAPPEAGGATKATRGDTSNIGNRLYVTTRPVYNANGKVCGEIAGPVLQKAAKPNHMLKRPAAWGWDRAIIEQARAAGCTHTEITCQGVTYRASLADFERYGVAVNRGYGAQVALPLLHWQKRKAGEAAPVQLGLFDGLGGAA